MKKLHGWEKALLFSVVGAATGTLLTFFYLGGNKLHIFDADCEKNFPLISHAVGCEEFEDSSTRLQVLQQKFEGAIELYKQSGKAKRISVWVRDLETRQWAATAEFEQYAPASFLKLPLMITYFKIAELEPTILKTEIAYTTSPELNNESQTFAPDSDLEVGTNYSVERLIEAMVINSDNNAAAVLLAHLDQSIFTNTLVDLGVKIPNNEKTYDFVTAKSYANIFRLLYNSSYLSREYSEKSLELLSKSSFKGMNESLPSSVRVAHKFGERETTNHDGTVGTRELHDCGIVYKNNRTYSLCIMTEGSDFSELQNIIENISLLAYQAL